MAWHHKSNRIENPWHSTISVIDSKTLDMRSRDEESWETVNQSRILFVAELFLNPKNMNLQSSTTDPKQ